MKRKEASLLVGRMPQEIDRQPLHWRSETTAEPYVFLVLMRRNGKIESMETKQRACAPGEEYGALGFEDRLSDGLLKARVLNHDGDRKRALRVVDEMRQYILQLGLWNNPQRLREVLKPAILVPKPAPAFKPPLYARRFI